MSTLSQSWGIGLISVTLIVVFILVTVANLVFKKRWDRLEADGEDIQLTTIDNTPLNQVFIPIWAFLSFFACSVGAWILYIPAELAYDSQSGICALLYAIALILGPLCLLCMAPHVQKYNINYALQKQEQYSTDSTIQLKIPVGLSDFALLRFGRPHQLCIFFCALLSMILNCAGALALLTETCLRLCPDVDRSFIICSVFGTCFIYVTIFRVRASVFTDLYSLLVTIICLSCIWNSASALFPYVDTSHYKRLLFNISTPTKNVGESGLYVGLLMIFSYIPAYVTDQSVWIRYNKNQAIPKFSWIYMASTIAAACFTYIMGIVGLIALCIDSNVYEEITGQTASSQALIFTFLGANQSLVLYGIILICTVFLTISTVDNMLSGIPALIAYDIFENFYKTQSKNIEFAQMKTSEPSTRYKGNDETSSDMKSPDTDISIHQHNIEGMLENGEGADTPRHNNTEGFSIQGFLRKQIFLLSSIIINIPCLILALFWNESVVVLFLMSNILCSIVLPPIVLGLWEKPNFIDTFFGIIAGVLAVPFSGFLLTQSLYYALIWFTFPYGVLHYFTMCTFIIVPLIAVLSTLLSLFIRTTCF